MPTCSSDTPQLPDQPLPVVEGAPDGTMLPRLVYIGDVPVEESFAGSTQLFRLLKTYPTDRLLIVEVKPFNGGHRLPGVEYRRFAIGRDRLLRTRIRSSYASGLLAMSRRFARDLDLLIADFAPNAVLSVAHGLAWSAAYRFARTKELPFHLLLHDDWRNAIPIAGALRRVARHFFGAAYRSAAERHCISPYMAEAFRGEFGIGASVLPPCRGDDCPTYDGPATPRPEPSVFCYAGSLHNTGYRDLVFRLARNLPTGSRLLLFTAPGVDVPVDLRGRIELRAPLPTSRELISCLRSEADVLFCPSSFRAQERRAMSLNLPSKLADYTASGLPILVWGPAESSPVKWARENSGAALSVISPSDDALLAALQMLREVEVRKTLAQTAMQVGGRCFSGVEVRSQFLRALIATETVHSTAKRVARSPQSRWSESPDEMYGPI